MIIEIGPGLAQLIGLILLVALFWHVMDLSYAWCTYDKVPCEKQIQHIIHEEIVKEGGQDIVS